MPTPKAPNDGFPGCVVAWFVFCALAAVGVLGVIVWAVITLVTHFTA